VVLVTYVDTATTVRNNFATLRCVLGAAGDPALLAVDTIASMGCDEYHMGAWGGDVSVAAS
jgi:alanine-glyoxylate transaminase/serine-glyoxylate transaminase/serine-pyruvate transaminase